MTPDERRADIAARAAERLELERDAIAMRATQDRIDAWQRDRRRPRELCKRLAAALLPVARVKPR